MSDGIQYRPATPAGKIDVTPSSDERSYEERERYKVRDAIADSDAAMARKAKNRPVSKDALRHVRGQLAAVIDQTARITRNGGVLDADERKQLATEAAEGLPARMGQATRDLAASIITSVAESGDRTEADAALMEGGIRIAALAPSTFVVPGSEPERERTVDEIADAIRRRS
jgi:hypothetical protein